MTELGQRLLKLTVRRSHQLSAESTAKSLQTLCGHQTSTTVHRGLHGMSLHGQTAASKPYITKCNAKCKCNAMHRMQRRKARRHCTLEQWRCVPWSDQSCISGNPMDMSGFGGCQENGTCLTALCQV